MLNLLLAFWLRNEKKKKRFRVLMRRIAYKFRLNPTKTQLESLRRMGGSCRFTWNKLLQQQNARLKRGQSVDSAFTMMYKLPLLKRYYPFLKEEAFSHNLQGVCSSLSNAFKAMFDKKRPNMRKPKFKGKGRGESIRFKDPQRIKIEGKKVRIPKIGWVKFRKSRELIGKLKNTMVVEKSGKWYVIFQCEIESEPVKHPSNDSVGLDLGCSVFAATSDGDLIDPINAFENLKRKLKYHQRRLSRKKKFSNNWKKQNKLVNNIHTKIANIRRDFLHKLSTKISIAKSLVVVEDLKISKMLEQRKSRNLNRRISDQGWGIFVEMLQYKLDWSGGSLIKVNPAYTSQTCSKCDHVHEDNRKTQADFKYIQCGYTANADINAANNILRAGLAHCGV